MTVSGTAPAIGSTTQFIATARLSDARTQDVTSLATWQSTAPSIAPVSVAGVVSGVMAGIAHITATYQSVSCTADLTVIADTTSHFTVRGTVTNARTGSPIGNVGVSIGTSQGNMSATTDNNGIYAIGNVANGFVTVVASLTGFLTNSNTAIVSGANLRMDIALTPSTSVSSSR